MSADWETRIRALAASWPGTSLLDLLASARCIAELRDSGLPRLRLLAVEIRHDEAARLERVRAAWERTGPHDGEYEAIFAYLTSALEVPA